MNIRWKPHVTVAAIIELNGRFLLVEEHTPDGLRLNNPAGHLDPGESPTQGCARETLEETGFLFNPEYLVGIYIAQSNQTTYLRFAFGGTLGSHDKERVLDDGIVRTLWLSADEARTSSERHRSPMVLRGIDDYLLGKRYPLELIYTDSSIFSSISSLPET
jgi:8-oxo-dGTP pyrophosphatase MutT (NUDIX family)